MENVLIKNGPTGTQIRQMFDSLAPRYDLFNRVTSLGMDKSWRNAALKPLKKGMRVLDLGCGTGDLALDAMRVVGSTGYVLGIDFSERMLAIAENRRRAMKGGVGSLRFERCKAEELPLAHEQLFDAVVSGFVLRNIYENIDSILLGIKSSLKSGGLLRLLDITEPKNLLVKNLWEFYMNSIVVLYGKIIFGKKYPSFYLTQSAKRFCNASEFIAKLKEKGFSEVRTTSFMFGMITLYEAVNP